MQKLGPKFICIGAQKAGTTWLYNQLKAHPNFWIPPQKELHYFDRSNFYSSPSDLAISSLSKRLTNDIWVEEAKKRIINSIDKRRPSQVAWWSNYLFSEYSDSWYLSLFEMHSKKITGELTPAYSMLSKADVLKMAQLLPETKIIFLIRNPVLRAWSMLRFAAKQGKRINFNDEDSLIRETNAKGQAHRSDYIRTIENYTEAFGSERILLGFYDAISLQPQDLMSHIFQFLEVDDKSLEGLNLKAMSNVSPKIEMPKLVFEHLRKKYGEPISLLSKKYGSYCNLWEQYLNNQDSQALNTSQFSAAFRLSDI